MDLIIKHKSKSKLNYLGLNHLSVNAIGKLIRVNWKNLYALSIGINFSIKAHNLLTLEEIIKLVLL